LSVEVKIGVKGALRELTVDTTLGPDEVAAAVREALASDAGVLILAGEKGQQVMVPRDKLAYIEIGEQVERRVGFSM
jgi:Protein of unknown function (DUF3107)